jgi:hypothetical protein
MGLEVEKFLHDTVTPNRLCDDPIKNNHVADAIIFYVMSANPVQIHFLHFLVSLSVRSGADIFKHGELAGGGGKPQRSL